MGLFSGDGSEFHNMTAQLNDSLPNRTMPKENEDPVEFCGQFFVCVR